MLSRVFFLFKIFFIFGCVWSSLPSRLSLVADRGATFQLQCVGFLPAVAAPRLQSTGSVVGAQGLLPAGTRSKVTQLRSGGGGVGTLGAVVQARPRLLCVSLRRTQTYGSMRTGEASHAPRRTPPPDQSSPCFLSPCLPCWPVLSFHLAQIQVTKALRC